MFRRYSLPILLLLSALLCLVQLFILLRQFTVIHLLWLAATVFLTVMLFRGDREKLLWDAFLALAAAAALDFFLGFSDGSYLVVTEGYQTSVAANRFACVLPGLLCFAGVLGITALGGVQYASKFPAIGEKIRKFGYVPALLFAVVFALSLGLGLLIRVFGESRWEGLGRFAGLRTLLWGLYALALGMQAAGREAVITRSAEGAEGNTPAPLRYCSVARLLFLSLITFGIWALVWIWRSTAVLKPWEEKHPRRPWLETLCCLLLPCYAVYWTYKSAQLCEKALADEPDSRFPLFCTLFGALLPPVGMCLLQGKVNELADRAEEGIEVELEILETVPESGEEPLPDGGETGEAFVREQAPETEPEPEDGPEPGAGKEPGPAGTEDPEPKPEEKE